MEWFGNSLERRPKYGNARNGNQVRMRTRSRLSTAWTGQVGHYVCWIRRHNSNLDLIMAKIKKNCIKISEISRKRSRTGYVYSGFTHTAERWEVGLGGSPRKQNFPAPFCELMRAFPWRCFYLLLLFFFQFGLTSKETKEIDKIE